MTGGEAMREWQAVKIALAVALSLVVAEGQRDSAALSFIAPLAAAALASGPAAPASALLVLPPLAWGMAVLAGIATQWLAGMPLALAAVQFAAFRAGFAASTDPRRAVPSVLMLIIAAVMPVVLIRAPELSADIASWLGINVAIACLVVLLLRWLLPDREGEGPPAAPPARRRLPLPPAIAAAALLVAVVLVAWMGPPAKGALLVSVILSLRAESAAPEAIMWNRFGAAFVGGAAAWAVWTLLGLMPSLIVLFVSVLMAAWVMASRATGCSAQSVMWLKALNAFAILLGEGFSVLFEDTAERLGIRIAGVTIGLAYGVVVLWLAGAKSAPMAEARPVRRRLA